MPRRHRSAVSIKCSRFQTTHQSVRLLQSIEYFAKLLNRRFEECEGQSLPSFSDRAGPIPPTHLLALFDSTSNNIILQPTHDLILSSQCLNAPDLSTSTRFSLLEPTFCAVQLHLPHPAMFEPLHRYLYNQNATELLALLLLPAKSQRRQYTTNRSGDKLIKTRNFRSQMALMISRTYSVASLHSQGARVRHFRENMQALGVHNVEMWRLVTIASTVIRSAIQIQKLRLIKARREA